MERAIQGLDSTMTPENEFKTNARRALALSSDEQIREMPNCRLGRAVPSGLS